MNVCSQSDTRGPFFNQRRRSGARHLFPIHYVKVSWKLFLQEVVRRIKRMTFLQANTFNVTIAFVWKSITTAAVELRTPPPEPFFSTWLFPFSFSRALTFSLLLPILHPSLYAMSLCVDGSTLDAFLLTRLRMTFSPLFNARQTAIVEFHSAARLQLKVKFNHFCFCSKSAASKGI